MTRPPAVRTCYKLCCIRKPRRRRAWPVGLRDRVLFRKDNPKGAGRCWHCGIWLTTGGHWHIDHYPVPYRDIEDQACCGFTSELDERNLVPSCAACNVGHANEGRGKPWFCGRTQCCCLRSVLERVVLIIVVWLLGLLCGALLGALLLGE